jgi:hypothetical protein
MTLPLTVDARHLLAIQPLPKGERRRIAAELVKVGLFESGKDYTDEITFYTQLLAVYGRGPGGLEAINYLICTIGSSRGASRRRLATSFLRRALTRLSERAKDEIRERPVADTLFAIAKVALVEGKPDIAIDCLWISWLYGADASQLRDFVKYDSGLYDVIGGWPAESGESLEDIAVQMKQTRDRETTAELLGTVQEENATVKLKRLLDRLESARAKADARDNSSYSLRLAEARRLLDTVPLLHGTTGQHLTKIWEDQSIRSRRELGLKELPHQRCFGTYGAVYASLGVMYPQRQAAIALSASIEGNADLTVDASPWDSGTFYSLAPKLGLKGDSDRAQVYDEHTLPAPLYRTYFAEYVTTCFANGMDYLRGRKNAHIDPLNVLSVWPSDLLVRVFEAHLSPTVNLRADQIEAVFLPAARLLNRKMREVVLPKLHRAGIRVEYYGRQQPGRQETNATPADLQRYVTRWICSRASLEREPGWKSNDRMV